MNRGKILKWKGPKTIIQPVGGNDYHTNITINIATIEIPRIPGHQFTNIQQQEINTKVKEVVSNTIQNFNAKVITIKERNT